MKKITGIKAVNELLWWCLTAIITALVLYPIVSVVNYKYIWLNVVFVATLVTAFRYILQFKSLILFRNGIVRFILIVININLFLFILNRFQFLVGELENFSLFSFAYHVPEMSMDKQIRLLGYIQKEIVFFASGSLIMLVMFTFRIIVSYWQKNLGRLWANEESSATK